MLRQSYREGKRVRKRTLANLTHLPPEIIEIIKPALRGEQLVLAMIAERLLHGCSKLASTRLWHTTTPAARHLGEGAQVFYDVSSSYYEGRTCPLARHGHNRDGLGAHSFSTLLEDLGTLCRNRCRLLADPSGKTFAQDTQPTPMHARVFQTSGRVVSPRPPFRTTTSAPGRSYVLPTPGTSD
ncbi:MAG: hypothetical protein KAY37_08795 [Phycisphaerae bacterium]|nr:hypothetical protein [Phycisphaerae bacterium]